jgi:hypothetical protein
VSDSARWQISDLAYLYEQTKCTYFATACRKSVDPKVRRARSLCRLRSPAIAEPASITKARRRARAGPCLMYQVPCCYLLARPQSCRRRPLQLGESTSEAVVALFLAVWCRALDYRSQVFLPTRPPPIPYPHPGLTLACVSTHYAAVHCHRRPPPCPATHLSLHARSYRPSGTTPAANHLSGTHARDRRHRYIYIHPARTQPLHYIALYRKQPARAHPKATYTYTGLRISDHLRYGILSSACLAHKALLPLPQSSAAAYGVDEVRAPT